MELAFAAPIAPALALAERDLDANRRVEAAYLVHGPVLRRRLLALTRDLAAAEDFTQEAFVRLSLEVRSRREPDNVGAWLHRVGANLVASGGRHAKVVDRREAELRRPDLEPSPEAASIRAEEATEVRRALATLRPMDQHALLLAAHGYRGPEIAHRLGRSQGATRTLLCRARTKMRHQLVAAGVTR